ncbi:MAG: membrane protein insertion efficiency factor YidD [bacterium]|nr:membrane protein insertion efficiency factor YidD [bacterium]
MRLFRKFIQLTGNIFSGLVIGFIKAYKLLISPMLPPSCRFYPTCSAYAIEALRKHGLFKGTFLAVMRIVRCNPLSRGGYDPVPETFHFFQVDQEV